MSSLHRIRWILAAAISIIVLGAAALPTVLAAPGGPGQTLITVHPVEWRGAGPNTVVVNGLDVAELSTTTPGPASASVSPDLPTAWLGRRMRLVEAQFCYDATATDVTMTTFTLLVHRNTTGTTKTNPVAASIDTTARNDEACRSYPVDWVLDPGDMVAVNVAASFASAGPYLQIGRLTFVLELTNTSI